MSYSKEKIFQALSLFYYSGGWQLRSSSERIDIKDFDIFLLGINGIFFSHDIKLVDKTKIKNNRFNISVDLLKNKLSELNYPEVVVNSQSHPIINLKIDLNGLTENFRIASRSLPMSKISNFRDMGGYPTIDNRQVIWGKLFRSGHLGELSDSDRKVLIEHKVKVVCDFRDLYESKSLPSQLPKELSPISIPISPASIIDFFKKLKERNVSSEDLDIIMERINIELVRDHNEKYKLMFDLLIENNIFSSIIHCSAGKDRTGFGAMLILAALGVPEKIIMRDYLYSNDYIDVDIEIERWLNNLSKKNRTVDEMKNFNKFLEFDRDILKLILQVKRKYLQRAIDTINKNYNGIDNYLLNKLGLNDEKKQALKNIYLYP